VITFEELKRRQNVMWGTGPYQRITDTLTDLHERVIERLDPRPGARWPDHEATARELALYGPTKTLADSLDRERRDELHRTWVESFERNYRRDGEIDHDREYLLVIGVRR
jgi:hypothetical protein